MKLLLDTHIILWSVLEPRRIGSRLQRLIERPDSELFYSPISVWELLLLSETGRLRLASAFEAWLADVIAALSLQELPLTTEVIVTSREVALPHKDPADRLLAATARYYDLKLVTADERLLDGSGFPTMANR